MKIHENGHTDRIATRTDLRRLDGHESHEGVFELCHCDPSVTDDDDDQPVVVWRPIRGMARVEEVKV